MLTRCAMLQIRLSTTLASRPCHATQQQVSLILCLLLPLSPGVEVETEDSTAVTCTAGR